MVSESKSIFCFFVILLAIFGCGSDEDIPAVDEDPAKKIVGSWELVTINGKSPKADAQASEDDWEVVEAKGKRVFAADGSFFIEIELLMKMRVEDSTIIAGFFLDFTVRMYLAFTLNGTYVVSDQVIEQILGDRVNVDFDFSIDDAESFPELEELEQEVKKSAQEFAREAEEEFVQEFELEVSSIMFNLEDDRLTLVHDSGRKEVYRKK